MPQTVFKVGDVVRLKSGGPKMTVSEIVIGTKSGTESVTVRCTWFHDNRVESYNFQQDILKDASADAT